MSSEIIRLDKPFLSPRRISQAVLQDNSPHLLMVDEYKVALIVDYLSTEIQK